MSVRLREAIDALVAFVLANVGHFLSENERRRLFDLDGYVVGLLAVVANGKISLPAKPEMTLGGLRYTDGAAVPFSVSPKGTRMYLDSQWQEKMRSLRSAVQAVIDSESAADGQSDGQKDNVPDKPKKTRNRCPKNAGLLRDLKRAIEKGQEKGMTKIDVAKEFADEEKMQPESLLRSLRRHRDHPAIN
ncbi:MAG: hypothetical protein HY040_15870 [Planctomycetes bacterium]|nr:hypothetical protein [Planctomycetota bacterium]